MEQQPGWHPHPDDETRLRYWDGSAWTDERIWDGTGWTEVTAGADEAPATPVDPSAGASPAPGWYPHDEQEDRLRFWDGSDWTDERIWDGSDWVGVEDAATVVPQPPPFDMERVTETIVSADLAPIPPDELEPPPPARTAANPVAETIVPGGLSQQSPERYADPDDLAPTTDSPALEPASSLLPPPPLGGASPPPAPSVDASTLPPPPADPSLLPPPPVGDASTLPPPPGEDSRGRGRRIALVAVAVLVVAALSAGITYFLVSSDTDESTVVADRSSTTTTTESGQDDATTTTDAADRTTTSTTEVTTTTTTSVPSTAPPPTAAASRPTVGSPDPGGLPGGGSGSVGAGVAIPGHVARSCGASGNGDCFVSVRTGPDSSNPEVRRANEGSLVAIVCQVSGESVKSSVLGYSTSVWLRDASGNYMSAAFVDVPGWSNRSITQPC